MTRPALLSLFVALASAACSPSSTPEEAEPTNAPAVEDEAADDEPADDEPDDEGTPEGAAAEAAPPAASDGDAPDPQAACEAVLRAAEPQIAAVLPRLAAAYAGADPAVGPDDFSRSPTPESARAALFGALAEDTNVVQATARLRPTEGMGGSIFMRVTNTRSRGAARFTTTVAGQEVQVRLGATVDLDSTETTDACWFDLTSPQEDGGSVELSVTLDRSAG